MTRKGEEKSSQSDAPSRMPVLTSHVWLVAHRARLRSMLEQLTVELEETEAALQGIEEHRALRDAPNGTR